MEPRRNMKVTSTEVTGLPSLHLAAGFKSTTIESLLESSSTKVPRRGSILPFRELYVMSGSYIRLKRPPTGQEAIQLSASGLKEPGASFCWPDKYSVC